MLIVFLAAGAVGLAPGKDTPPSPLAPQGLNSSASAVDKKMLLPLTPTSDFDIPKTTNFNVAMDTQGLLDFLKRKDNTKIILISQYYQMGGPSATRQKEIDRTLVKNVQNGAIDEVHLLTEEQVQLPPGAERARVTNLGRRLTWRDGFDHAATVARGHEGKTLAMVANADIWFDESVLKLKNAGRALESQTLYMLSRYGDGGDPRCVPSDGGHADTAIFEPPVPASVNANYPLGLQGTETRLIYELKQQGYSVSNPCKILISHHEHGSNERTYDPKNDISAGFKASPNSPPPTDKPMQKDRREK